MLLLPSMSGIGDVPKSLRDAIACGKINVIRELIAKGADANAKDEYGHTPLHEAVWNTNPSKNTIVKILIEAGADINTADEDGWTPLHHAAENSASSIAKILIEARADITLKTKKGKTALDMAKADDTDTLETLLDAYHRQRRTPEGCGVWTAKEAEIGSPKSPRSP
jgi:ankyrin repeat protein